jgi:hypothetical protein
MQWVGKAGIQNLNLKAWRGRNHLGHKAVHERIILEWILQSRMRWCGRDATYSWQAPVVLVMNTVKRKWGEFLELLRNLGFQGLPSMSWLFISLSPSQPDLQQLMLNDCPLSHCTCYIVQAFNWRLWYSGVLSLSLKMEVACFSVSGILHGISSQNSLISVFTAVRSSDLVQFRLAV